MLGDGRGGFKPAQGSPIPVGSSARKVAIGDANRDGHLDIFVARHDSYEVVALLGDGRGGFKPAPASPFVAASGPHVHPRAHTHSITTGDVNGDGNLDLLTTNANDNSVSVLLGDGKGGFAPSGASPIKAGRHPYDTVTLNDVNNDGKADLITPNLRGNAVMVMLGDGKGGFITAANSPMPAGNRRLSDLRGKVVMLDFMASWCGICVATLPEIKELYSQFERSKVEIVSVSLDGGETTDSTLRERKIRLLIFLSYIFLFDAAFCMVIV